MKASIDARANRIVLARIMTVLSHIWGLQFMRVFLFIVPDTNMDVNYCQRSELSQFSQSVLECPELVFNLSKIWRRKRGLNKNMQSVILAAGRGRRMKALTEDLPKPLLTVLGNNLLEHKISILPKEVGEVIIVIGYLGDKIKKHFGASFKGKKIRYVKQKTLSGTMPALKETEKILRGRFMVMMGDDLYSKEDVADCLKHPWSILVKKMSEMGRGARVVVNEKNHITDIVEGAELEKGMLNNAGLYVLQTDIFKYPLVQIPSGEFGLPQTLARATKDFEISVVESKNWHQITEPEDLERVEKILKK